MDYNEIMSSRGRSYTTFENIEELLYNGTDESNVFLQIVTSCSDLFLATTIEPFSGDTNITLNSPIFSSTAIFKDFIYENYGDLYCRYEFLKHNEEQNITQSKLLERVYNYCVAFHDSNYYKYTGLIESINEIYNPIENYNMIEDGTNNNTNSGNNEDTKTYNSHTDDDLTKGGNESIERSINANNISYAEMTGPLSSGSISTDGSNLTFDSNAFIKNESIGNGVKVQHDTSTEDNDAGRFEYSDTTTGGTQTTNPLMGKMSSGSPNAYGFTDTTSFTNRTDTRDISVTGSEHNTGTTRSTDTGSHHLTRQGNIGVTTTQQMLEQERNIRMINIAKMYFDELFSGLALNVWR